MTGRAAGYCAVAEPRAGRPYGYAGLQGAPIRGGFFSRLGQAFRRGRGFGRGAGRRGGRGRW